MLNYDLHPQMILRVPRLPVKMEAASLDELLCNPVFRDALFLASDSLYEELCRNDFQLNRCGEKMRFSLAKYQKRMCYRPTPFGSFAGVAVYSFEEMNNAGLVIDTDSFQVGITEKKKEAIFAEDQNYFINPLIYSYGTDFRVLAKSEEENTSTFVISEIYGSELIKELTSGDRIINREVLTSLTRDHGIEEGTDCFIADLVQLQIIIPHKPISPRFPYPLTEKHKTTPGSSYDSFCSFSACGSLPQNTSRRIYQAISCLGKISRSYEPDALKEFKNRFEKLFDRQKISLLQALDPELGIDYDGLSDGSISSMPGTKIPGGTPWSPLHETLLRKWTQTTGTGVPELEILDEDLAEFNSPQRQYPPGISLMFSLCDNKLLLKAAGGVSGLNMIGRFTVLNQEIRDLARELALKEIHSNPQVVFAEISHIDSPAFASVKRKAIVYDYQIPFFEPPEVPEKFLIGLNDLYISLANNKLRLWSCRLNKQVIPRFSSAYNYHKSTLPVFRFLCDLQQEGVHANLNFSLLNLFPGMRAYPRVTYQDIILESASWHLEAQELLHLKKLDPQSQFAAFHSLAVDIGLPEEFSYEVHDHLLHINRSSKQDINLLLKTIPASGKIIFREYFKSQESLVKDDKSEGYTHECIAFLTNKDVSYESERESVRQQNQVPENQEKLFPFDDWLYFKIYLHPAGYTDLLINNIRPFIAQNLRKGNINSWYFISYYDEGFHLRLRVKQTPGREWQLLKSYRKLEKEFRQMPNVKKLELSTYFKERERYAPIGIQSAEKLFRLSSEIVLSELSQPDLVTDPDKDRVFSGVRHLLMVWQAMWFGLTEIEGLSKGFTAQLSKSEKIEMDVEFREQRKGLMDFLVSFQEKSSLENDYLEALVEATARLSQNGKLEVIADINHMHLNRLFLKDQRRLERKSYCFLGKVVRGEGFFKTSNIFKSFEPNLDE